MTARLINVRVPKNPAAVVVVLHGGGSRERGMAVSPTQLSVVRMIPIARRIARQGRGRLAVLRLLNSVRGWDAEHTPVDDVRWALQEVAQHCGRSLPVGLVGHSLGGRAAILSADMPPVRSVVALAPWVKPEEAPVRAPDARVLIVHGTDDRIASPERSRSLARRLQPTVKSLAYVSVRGGKHAMLSRHSVFDGLAAQFVTAALLPDSHPTGRVARLLDGTTGADFV